MKIAVGNSRMDKKWKNKDISWDDLLARVKSTIRTTETVSEYRKMSRSAQDATKDVGGFVGGALKEGRRKKGYVLSRSLLTLDMDYGKPGIWDSPRVLHEPSIKIIGTTPPHDAMFAQIRKIVDMSGFRGFGVTSEQLFLLIL